MNLQKCAVLIIVVTSELVVLGCGTSAPLTVHAASQQSEVQHDPTMDHCAWVYCLDTSRSPLPEQFQKLKRVFQASVKGDLRGNDLAWLIPIGSGAPRVQLVPMPPVPFARSARQGSNDRLQKTKGRLIDIIGRLEQDAGRTDLKDPIESGLNILLEQPQAREKYLLIGSDFVEDEERGRLSLDPPNRTEGITAEGVHVIILITIPKNEYLRGLNISDAGLYRAISEKWGTYFRGLGAIDTTVRLVDAVAII